MTVATQSDHATKRAGNRRTDKRMFSPFRKLDSFDFNEFLKSSAETSKFYRFYKATLVGGTRPVSVRSDRDFHSSLTTVQITAKGSTGQPPFLFFLFPPHALGKHKDRSKVLQTILFIGRKRAL